MTCCYDSVKAGHCHSKGRGQCKHFICFRTAHCAMIGTLIREPKPQGFVIEFIPVSKRSWKKPACPWCHKHDGENKREKRHYEEGSWQAPLPTSALRLRLSKEVNGPRFTHTMNVAAHTKLIGVKWVKVSADTVPSNSLNYSSYHRLLRECIVHTQISYFDKPCPLPPELR